jgi:hypothetical protein
LELKLRSVIHLKVAVMKDLKIGRHAIYKKHVVGRNLNNVDDILKKHIEVVYLDWKKTGSDEVELTHKGTEKVPSV